MTEIEAAHWAAMLKSPSGMHVLLEVLGICRVDEPSFATDDRTTALNEGRRAVGLAIRRKIEAADPEGWLKVVKQEIENERQRKLERDKRDAGISNLVTPAERERRRSAAVSNS